MSRIPYRATMRPQRTPPVVRPGSPAATEAPAPVEAPQPVEVELEKPPAPEAPVAVEEEKVEEEAAPAPAPVEPVVSEPVAAAPVAPKVNSASSKTDLLAAASALGLTSVSATNTRAEIWAAIQAATVTP